MDAALEQALRSFAAEPTVLVALDFDGTLAPLVSRPEDARATAANAAAVARLAQLDGVNVALVSGRPLDELRDLADPPPSVVLVGSHGAQRHAADVALDGSQRALLAELTATLDEVSAQLPHTHVERKAFAAALHTRPALEAGDGGAFERARAATSDLRDRPGVHVTEGHEVLEFSVVDPGTHNKGVAVRELADRIGVRATLFAGDDTTDESVFAVLDDDAGDVTIRVVAPSVHVTTRARHVVVGPDGVAEVLDLVDRERLAG